MRNADRSLGTWGRLHWVGLAALVAALGLCLMPGVADAAKKKKDTVKVATYNLYLGASLVPMIEAGNAGQGDDSPAGTAARAAAPDNLINEVGFVLKDVGTNDFNVRAETIAKQIKKNKLDLVGLQEAALFRLEVPTDGGGPGGLVPDATFATVPLIDYIDTLLNQLNKKARSKKQCDKAAKKRKAQGKKPKPCYRGYRLMKAQQEADIEQIGDFDNDPGPNGIGGSGPAFPPPCLNTGVTETNPGGDDTGAFLGDPGPPNPFGEEKDPVTGQPTPWDWNGDSSSNIAQGGTRNCGPDTVSGDFDTTPPPSGGFQYASDCPDNNPIGGSNTADEPNENKSDTTSSCLLHGVEGDARLTIRDVILAREGAGVKGLGAGGANYGNQMNLPILGGAAGVISFNRGFVSAKVSVRGKKFTFVNTHLENEVGTAESAAVREAQAAELVAPGGPAATGRVVLVGDLNSDPAGAEPAAYNKLAAAGFVPLTGPANTYGHAEILNNPSDNTFTKRIDWILGNSPSIKVRKSFVLNQFANGLWSSDHAGVVSVLDIPGGKKK